MAKPTLHQVRAKIGRAKTHAEVFHGLLDSVTEGHVYKFRCEVHDGGRKHLYKADHPQSLPPLHALIVGDCIHNLRSSLDHLADGLVRGYRNGQPTRQTTFPIGRSHRRNCLGVRRPVPTQVKPAIDPEALKIIDSVQPHRGTEIGANLAMLSELDNIDKHRNLLIGAGRVSIVTGSGYQIGVDPEPSFNIIPKPITKDGQIVLVVTYDPPRPEQDPDLEITPFLVFTETGYERRYIGNVIATLIECVENELLPLFAPFFAP